MIPMEKNCYGLTKGLFLKRFVMRCIEFQTDNV